MRDGPHWVMWLVPTVMCRTSVVAGKSLLSTTGGRYSTWVLECGQLLAQVPHDSCFVRTGEGVPLLAAVVAAGGDAEAAFGGVAPADGGHSPRASADASGHVDVSDAVDRQGEDPLCFGVLGRSGFAGDVRGTGQPGVFVVFVRGSGGGCGDGHGGAFEPPGWFGGQQPGADAGESSRVDEFDAQPVVALHGEDGDAPGVRDAGAVDVLGLGVDRGDGDGDVGPVEQAQCLFEFGSLAPRSASPRRSRSAQTVVRVWPRSWCVAPVWGISNGNWRMFTRRSSLRMSAASNDNVNELIIFFSPPTEWLTADPGFGGEPVKTAYFTSRAAGDGRGRSGDGRFHRCRGEVPVGFGVRVRW